MENSLAKERIQRWDNIKFFLIFLVVLGHIADIYANISFATGVLRFYIYTFHMPLFLFVSGLFSKKNIKQKRWKNIFSYLILYLFIKVIDFFAKWAATDSNPGFSLFKAASVPWYAFCLFAFSVIIILIDKVKPAYVIAFSVILACVA
ncbi:MAG: acyltransferase family protein, partial [Clostridia bacterium]|nr:acyltransferase family protein [Clostridia bacterium]